ncbi:hypothetical protein KDM41_12890 [bacterium]|nr:hypothetical protein [bacterium]
MKTQSRIMLAIVLALAAGVLVQPAFAVGERPVFAMPTSFQGPSDMLRPVEVIAGTPRDVGTVRRAADDPRDGTRPGGDRVREFDAQEKRYVANALKSLGDIGGDDVLFADHPSDYMWSGDLAIAENGDIYYAYTGDSSTVTWAEHVVILRSTDGGTTFSPWGQIGDDSGSNFARLVKLLIVEGTVSRLYVQYMVPGFDQLVAYSQLGLASASWTTRTVFQSAGVSFISGAMTSDVVSFDGFYLYAVASGLDGNGDDIWYARSTDYGSTWSAPYRIASLTHDGDAMYYGPKVEYGFGGAVHVAWTYTGRLSATHDDGVRYRRALNYGSADTDWDFSIWALKFTTDGIDQDCLDLAASTTDSTVAIVHGEGGFGGALDPHILWTTTAGRDWNGYGFQDLPWDFRANVEIDHGTSTLVGSGFAFDGGNENIVLSRSSLFTLHTWSPPERFNDTDVTSLIYEDLALDPSRGHQAAVVFAEAYFGGEPTRLFDAEWRGGPGYPDDETGFPVDLPAPPNSPPAIVNIDYDPYGEIVFGTADDMIQVYSHTGTIPGGWPQHVPNLTPGAPIAVGQLDLGPLQYIVAGTTDGKVYAYDLNSLLMPGFPVDLGTGAATYVSIGNFGGPYPHLIVACSGDHMFYINYRGEIDTWVKEFTGPITHPAAIGDVDGDGVTETVTLMGPSAGTGWSYLHVMEKNQSGPDYYRPFYTESWSDAPTLFDLDGDGDLEIAAPTNQGLLYVMHHDGTDVTGFPFDNGTGVPLTSAVAANNLGNSPPELAFASRDYRVHLLWASGVQQSGYPAATSVGWWNYAAPILDKTSYAWASVVIGSRGFRAWSFDNFGTLAEGWPKPLAGQCELSPAAGDIDLDGNNEVVFLDQTQLVVVDMGHPGDLDGSRKWPMYGYDPQRTGCANCLEDLASAAPEPGVTRVSFAPPSPNPASGPTLFRYEIPSHATVNLEVFDVRGYRVRRVHRSEENAGPHVVTFDGRDQQGRELAAGQYFARLTVRGPGIDRQLTRKLTLLR